MTGALDWKTLFISADGRLGRTPFWVASVMLVLVWALYEAITPGHTLARLTGWLVYPALIFFAACVLSKRLHDRGRSGWFAAPIIAGLIAVRPFPDGVIDFLFGVLLVWAAVELIVLGSEEGANRFGPNPTKAAAVA